MFCDCDFYRWLWFGWPAIAKDDSTVFVLVHDCGKKKKKRFVKVGQLMRIRYDVSASPNTCILYTLPYAVYAVYILFCICSQHSTLLCLFYFYLKFLLPLHLCISFCLHHYFLWIVHLAHFSIPLINAEKPDYPFYPFSGFFFCWFEPVSILCLRSSICCKKTMIIILTPG